MSEEIIERHMDGYDYVSYPQKRTLKERLYRRLIAVINPDLLLKKAIVRDTYRRQDVLEALQAGANVNVFNKDKQHNLLIAAVRRNDFDMATQALHHGADVNAQNKDGQTALMVACNNPKRKLIFDLLCIHQDINLNVKDKMGCCALDYAARTKNNELMKYFLEHGVKPTDKSMMSSVFEGNEQGVALLLKAKIDPTVRKDQKSYLDIAAKRGLLDIVNMLLPYETNPIRILKAQTAAHQTGRMYCVERLKHVYDTMTKAQQNGQKVSEKKQTTSVSADVLAQVRQQGRSAQ